MENKLITAMGMMAENMQRQALGESMAYVESDFQALLSDHKCSGELCIVCGYRKKISESDWEQEWEQEFDKLARYTNEYSYEHPIPKAKEIKIFIKNLLLSLE